MSHQARERPPRDGANRDASDSRAYVPGYPVSSKVALRSRIQNRPLPRSDRRHLDTGGRDVLVIRLRRVPKNRENCPATHFNATGSSRHRRGFPGRRRAAARRGRPRRDQHAAAGRRGRREPGTRPLLLRLDGRALRPGARALHRAARRAPARDVRGRRAVHREVAHGVALPAGGPRRRLLEDLDGASGAVLEPPRPAPARRARERGVARRAARGVRARRDAGVRTRRGRVPGRGARRDDDDLRPGLCARAPRGDRRGPRSSCSTGSSAGSSGSSERESR